MLKRIIHRFKQFYAAMFSKYTKVDKAYAQTYLNIEEMSLFNQLPDFEKKHSVVVGRKMLAASRLYPELDPRKLVKLGLLHDIGKVAEHNSIVTKSILVIFRFFLPRLYNWVADLGKDNKLFYRYYVHKHHGAIGAQLLAKIGESSELLSIIKKHDPFVEPFGSNDPIELKILQEADSTY